MICSLTCAITGPRTAGWPSAGKAPSWFVLCSEESIRTVLEEIDTHLRSTPVGGVQVMVLNGCGKAGVAAAAGERLLREGFEVETDNADNFNYEETIIRHSLGQRALAQAIRRALGVGRLEEVSGSEPQSDPEVDPSAARKIEVVVGSDFDRQSAEQ